MYKNDFNLIIKKYLKKPEDRLIQIGPCKVRLVSNLKDFPAYKYFSMGLQKQYKGEIVDYELYCLSSKKIHFKNLAKMIDKNYRGQHFAEGYYVTDHFGKPIYMVTYGKSYYIFGEQLEYVVWPYFTKYFLFLYSLKNKSLFLKTAAFSIGSSTTLIMGRGNAGKTVFLSNMCLNGANYISNSHVLVVGKKTQGILSSLRIRPEPWCKDIFDKENVYPGIIPGEIIVDPISMFKTQEKKRALIKNVCIIDYQGKNHHEVKKISGKVAYDYAEQFALGINVYRLEEDLLDLYKGDVHIFSRHYGKMKKNLMDLISSSNCYYISTNILDKKNRQEMFSLLK